MILKLPGIGGLLDKAPQALGDFLDQLLEKNKSQLDPKKGEVQIFYILFRDPTSKEYIISIVSADKEDKILRSIKSILLKDALSIIFNSNNYAN